MIADSIRCTGIIFVSFDPRDRLERILSLSGSGEVSNGAGLSSNGLYTNMNGMVRSLSQNS